MKHIKKLLPLVALLSLTGCGEPKEEEIEMTKKEAIATVAEANQKTLQSEGLAVKAETVANANAVLTGKNEDGELMTGTFAGNAQLNLDLEVLLNDTLPTALKAELSGSAGYSLVAGEMNQQYGLTASAGAYIKGYNVYAQASASTTGEKAAKLFEGNAQFSVFDVINSVTSEGFNLEIPGITLNQEMVEAVKGLKEVVDGALPEPTAVVKGDELTITYKLTQTDITKLIQDVSAYVMNLLQPSSEEVTPIAPIQTKNIYRVESVEEEEPIAIEPVAEEEEESSLMEVLLPILEKLNLNELSFSTTIKNGLITKVESKLDVSAADLTVGEATANGQVVLTNKMEISTLAKDHQIAYPQGMESWTKYPQEESKEESNAEFLK